MVLHSVPGSYPGEFHDKVNYIMFQGHVLEMSLTKCGNPTCTDTPADHKEALMNRVTMVIRAHVKKYYEVSSP